MNWKTETFRLLAPVLVVIHTDHYKTLCNTCFKVILPLGTSLAVQWLRLNASHAGGSASILGLGTKIPQQHIKWEKKKKETKLLWL